MPIRDKLKHIHWVGSIFLLVSHKVSKGRTLEGHAFSPNVKLLFKMLGVGNLDIYDIHSL